MSYKNKKQGTFARNVRDKEHLTLSQRSLKASLRKQHLIFFFLRGNYLGEKDKDRQGTQTPGTTSK